jgi:hypothetical protein
MLLSLFHEEDYFFLRRTAAAAKRSRELFVRVVELLYVTPQLRRKAAEVQVILKIYTCTRNPTD